MLLIAPIRILLADDHPIFLYGFERILNDTAGIEVVGTALNGRELLSLVETVDADVIITDVQMKAMGGIEATKKIKASRPSVKVIALSVCDNEEYVADMLKAGANGYMLKDTTPEELLKAVEVVLEGKAFFSSSISAKLAMMLQSNEHRLPQAKEAVFSAKEQQIMQLICEENSSKQIADKVGLTNRSVESAKERLQQKTGSRNMVGIAMYAVKAGIYKLGMRRN